jgi:hypothetical protein
VQEPVGANRTPGNPPAATVAPVSDAIEALAGAREPVS